MPDFVVLPPASYGRRKDWLRSPNEVWQEKIDITDYWLLGLIEGEGSFHLIRSRLVPVFAIKMVSDQEPLMKAIKRYLTDRLAFDEHSLFKLNNSELISINYVPPKGNSELAPAILR